MLGLGQAERSFYLLMTTFGFRALRDIQIPGPRISLMLRLNSASLVAVAAFFCLFYCRIVEAVGVSVSVNPVIGQDIPSCNLTLPCKSIQYAVRQRDATSIFLASERFSEPSIFLNSDASVLSISSAPSGAVFDCLGAGGPAFIISNTTVSISGISFRSCSNRIVSNGIGGALSINSSTVVITNCFFENNTALIGGAIGAVASALSVSSSAFSRNSAACTSNVSVCLAWGGAIAARESSSISLTGNNFTRNLVTLQAISDAAGGGGCVSILHKSNVSAIHVLVSGNVFQECLVRIPGNEARSTQPPRGVFYGNAYGGAVSIVHGLNSAESLDIRGVNWTVTDNIFLNCGITSSAGTGNCYGGGLSLHAGAWSVRPSNTKYNQSFGAVTVNSMQVFILNNTISNCSCRIVSFSANTGSSYGGAVSLVVGLYSSGAMDSFISGNTSIANSSFRIRSNTITSCVASINSLANVSSSNAYGGGMSLFFGAFSCGNSNSFITGNTQVESSIYDVSYNILRYCSATASHSERSFAYGTFAYGGGISMFFGAYSFTTYKKSSSTITGMTAVKHSSFALTRNEFVNCSALSATVHSRSYGANVYGGGLSLVLGAFSYSVKSSLVSGGTEVSSCRFHISQNTFSACAAIASSSDATFAYGSNAYGGGLSQTFGAYSYSAGANGSSSVVSGKTEFRSSSYALFSNTFYASQSSVSISGSNLENPDAESNTGTCDLNDGTFGANSYGGCAALVVGPYVYSSFKASIASAPGSLAVSDSFYNISNNTFALCTSSTMSQLSTLNGANVYGGGLLLLVGSYSYSRYSQKSSIQTSEQVSSPGNVTVRNCSLTILNNTFTSCQSIVDSSDAYGANVYGGGLSISFGPYSFAFANFILGSTLVLQSNFSVSYNILMNCVSRSHVILASYGSNAYGGGASFTIGGYYYSVYCKTFGSSDMVDSNYAVSNNLLLECFAIVEGIYNFGGNVYGGGISLALGDYSYHRNGVMNGSIAVLRSSYSVSDNSFIDCLSALSVNNSQSSTVYGGSLSIFISAYAYSYDPTQAIASGLTTVLASNLSVYRSQFSGSESSSLSTTCTASSNNAAGGAVSIIFPNGQVEFNSCSFADAVARTDCAASSSETYSLGGALFVHQVMNITIHSSNFTNCFVQGVEQANNVFVSGGGVFVDESGSVALSNSMILSSGVTQSRSAGFSICGGGAMGTKNVLFVLISSSIFHNNTDSCSTGIVFMLHVLPDSAMLAIISNGSVLYNDPSISTTTPVLSLSCGMQCHFNQQQLLELRIMDSQLISQSHSNEVFDGVRAMSIPMRSSLHAQNSSITCWFSSIDAVTVLGKAHAEDSIEVSCDACAKPFEFSPTSSSMELSKYSTFTNLISKLDSCRPLIMSSTDANSYELQQCPFGISICSTIVNVTIGFWTNFTEDGDISRATRCPTKYCGCRNIAGFSEASCRLFPPLSPDFRPQDALCRGNRTGVLCGGCKKNYTQSLNGYMCVSNDVCADTWPWVWTLSITGYALYSVYIVVTSFHVNSGLIMCVLLYGQVSSFASVSFESDDGNSADISTWLSKVSQMGSILSVYDNSCYGLDMGAFESTAAQLCGPAIVLVMAVSLTILAKWLQSKFPGFFRTHAPEFQVSFGAPLVNALQLLLSVVVKSVFQMITCQDVGFDVSVVYIDGTKRCEGALHTTLIVVAALVSIVPLLFWAALKWHKLPASARLAACSVYVDSRYYWGAATMFFRFVMTVVFTSARQFPSIAAMVLQICALCMLVVLIMLQPYVHRRTFFMDAFCYVCLIIQFALNILVRSSESLGFPVATKNTFRPLLENAAKASRVLQYMPFLVCFCLVALEKACLHLWRRGMNSRRLFLVRSNRSLEMRTAAEDLKATLL